MADEGFRISGAYVEVNLKDNTEADEKKIRSRLESAPPVKFDTSLNEPENLELVRERIRSVGPVRVDVKADADLASAAAAGTALAEWATAAEVGVKARLQSSAPVVKVRADADTALAQAKIKELAAKKNAAVIAIDADISKAQARITNLEAKRGKTKIDVDAEIAKAEAKIKALQAKRNRLLIQVDADQKSIDKASDKVESATQKVAERANAQFSALQFALMFAGLPAAAAVAGAGVAAGLAVVPAVFTAIAASSAGTNTQVSNAWAATTAHLKAQAQGWGAPFAQSFIDAANQVTDRVNLLSPVIGQAFRNSVPAVNDLTGGVLDLATNAMPGLLVATQNIQAPFAGLNSLLGQTGHGLTDFFANLSGGAQASQGILTTTGGLLNDLLGFAGSLFANLTNNGGPALTGFRADLSQVESVVLSLTASTSPLYGAVGGFLSTVSGGLSIVEGFASALRLLPPQLSQFGGSLLAVQKIAGLFGQSLTSTGFGLGAFASTVDDAGKKTTPFSKAMSDADGIGGKFKAGLTSIVSSGFNPLGLALFAGGLLLDVWGKKSQDAAKRAADQAKSVDDLTTAFQKDNGAIGANVTAVTTKALTDKNAYTNAQVFGAAMDDVSRAGLGQADAMDTVVSQAKSYVTQLLSGNKANRDMTPTVLKNVDAFAKQGGNASDLVDNLSAVRLHSLDLTDAQRSLLIRTLDGVAAIGQEGQAALDAAQKQAAMQAALDRTSQLLHDQVTPGMYAAQVSTANLKAAFNALNTAGGDVVAKGQAIIAMLDQLSGKQVSAEDALQAFNDTVRDLAKNLGQAQSDGSRFTKTMVDATGAINTTTAAGSSLQNIVQQAAQNMASYGQALVDAGAPADQITTKLGGMRDQLAAQLKQLGLAPQQIDAVLAHYNALPSEIVTALHLEGAPETQQALTGIITKLQQVPDNKGISVQALTADAQSALIQLGYHIVRLPNGMFQIFADTTAGDKAADEFAARNFGRQIFMVLDANATPANGKITATVQKADGSVGTITLDARKDPATGVLQVLVQQVNGTRGWMTIDAFNDAAKIKIGDAVRVANGSRGFIQVDASTAAAQGAVERFINANNGRYITITTRVTDPSGQVHSSTARLQAAGGVLRPFAAGGVAAFAGGGHALTPMAPVASVVPRDTWRVVGDRMDVSESYIPWDGSARSREILAQTNTAFGNTGSPAPQIDYQAFSAAVASAVEAVFAAGVSASWDTTSLEKGMITLGRRRATR